MGNEERRERGNEADGEACDAAGDPDPTDEAVVVEPGEMADTDAVADLWVALARGQRVHGSHLEPDANRERAREAAARAVVTGGLFVARTREPVEPQSGGPESAHERGVVGFATVGPESDGYEQDVRRGLVHNLFVRPAYRDAGVGGRLLDRAEAALAETGVDVVALEAMADNEAARRFYARQGYEPHRVELEKPVGDGVKR